MFMQCLNHNFIIIMQRSDFGQSNYERNQSNLYEAVPAMVIQRDQIQKSFRIDYYSSRVNKKVGIDPGSNIVE